MYAICAKCQSVLIISNITKIWHCTKNENDPAIDPITGEEGYWRINLMGLKYFTKDQYGFCKDINIAGNCSYYEENK